ncbi:MAG: glucosaminidase domain-containing protein [Carnobacterium sp.]|uniref:glucosaminidase domain-containing protein n=1 Tax=Carnobacterium sp. TaxID=48221 RepID=UPI003C72605A
MYKQRIKLNSLISVVLIVLLMSIFINPSTAYALENKHIKVSYEYLVNLDETKLNKVDPKYIKRFILENEIYINTDGLFETKKSEFIPYLHNLNKTSLKKVIKNNGIEIISKEVTKEEITEEVTKEEVREEEVTKEEVTKEEAIEEEVREEEVREEEVREEETKEEVREEEVREEEAIEEEVREEEVTEEVSKEEVREEEVREEEAIEEEVTKEEGTEEEVTKEEGTEKINKTDEKQSEINILKSNLNNNRLISDTTYVVQPGDYLSKIASIFNVTVAELVLWNNLANENIIRVGQTLYIKKPDFIEKPNFSTNQEFVDFAATYASQVAKNKGLYASVMIAQAILESEYGRSKLSKSPNNNLFGIKSFRVDEPRVKMRTAEQDSKGNIFYVDAYFRVYPSYYESFESNANLLRNNKLYSGVWLENAKNYQQATAWLQGRYATDVKYASKLNNLIQTHNLTQYDSTYRLETANFLGESDVQQNISKLKRAVNWDVRYEEVKNIEPFYSKEINVGEFYYEYDVKNAVESFKKETGMWAGYKPSGTYSHYYIIKTGTFNGINAVKTAVEKFQKDTGWYASYEHVDGNRYRMITGQFLGQTNLKKGLHYINKQGWWAESVQLSEKENNYVLYTGELNSEWSILKTKQYFANKNFSFKEIVTGNKIKYYRIVTKGSITKQEADSRVKFLKNTFNWESYSKKN